MRRISVFALCLGTTLLPLPLSANEEDKGFITNFLEDNLSGAGRDVRIDGFQGALSSRARMDRLTIADKEGVWLTLTDVTLDWSRAALFGGRVKVDALTAAEIDLVRLPINDAVDVPAPVAAPFALPDLPVSIQIGQLNAERIKLGPTVIGQPVEAKLVGGANLENGEGNAKLSLERIDGTMGILSLEGGFVNATRQARIDLALQEAPGGIAATLLGLPGDPALDLKVKGEGPIDDFTADVALRSDGEDRFSGKVRLGAKDGGRSFEVDLGGDVTPLFLPEYREFFGPNVALVARGATAADGALTLDQLSLKSSALSVEGQAALAPDGLPQKLDLTLDLRTADNEPVLLPLAGDPVRVAAANLKLAYDAAVTGDGWRLNGSVDQLDTIAAQMRRLQLDGEGLIKRGDSGKQEVSGEVTFTADDLAMVDPAMARALGANVTGGTRFDWVAGAPLSLRDLRIAGEGYEANGLLAVEGPATGLTIDGTLNATVADLAQFSDLAGRALGGEGVLVWQGKLTPLTGAFDGLLTVTGRDLRLDQPEADALLRGESTILLDAMRGEEGTHLRDLSVKARTLALKSTGWIRPTGPDLAANLDFSDLSVLGGGRAGSFVADATLKGTSFDNDITLALTGRGTGLKLAIPQADGFLEGGLAIDGAAHLLDGRVTLRGLKVAGEDWSTEASGYLSETLRDLAATFDLASLRRAGPGFAGGLNGKLSYSLLDGTETVGFEATGTNLAVGQAEADRLLRGTTRLEAKALRKDGLLRIEDFNLSNPQLSATADASQAGDQRQVTLNARLGDLALIVPGVPGPLVLGGTINEVNGQLAIDLDATGPGGIDLAIDGSAPLSFGTANLTIKGRADAALANAFLGPVAVRGPLNIDLALNGAPGLEALSGTVGISDARLTVANPPFSFSGVNGRASFGGGRVSVDLAANNDLGGRVLISGPVALSAPFNGDLRITQEQMKLRDPQLYETRANGTLSINGPLTGGAMIAGAIDLWEAELRIPSTGLGGVAAIPELRHFAEPAPVRRTRARAGLLGEGRSSGASGGSRPYGLDVTINAPNQIFIRGRGLDAELGGSFRITGSTSNIVPSGGLELVRGRLDLLGKRFEFTEGQLQMEGSLVPTIRLVATTETVDGSANVVIDGPADEPVISFTSTPELPEEEVVARLLFGRGLTTLTPLQAAQLASAVATLTGKGGGGVVDRLRQNFGLDDFDVSASESGAAAVRAGKYISDKVYVDLQLDSDGKSEVSINLDVTQSVTVRGRAGSDGNTGVGVHYERDY